MESTTALDGRSAHRGMDLEHGGSYPRARRAPTEPATWIARSVASLWTLLDTARLEAAAWQGSGAAGNPVAVIRETNQRRYYVPGTGRYIAVQLFLPARDAQFFGGAFITTSLYPRALHLIPQEGDERARWLVAATDAWFDPPLASALFAGVLGGDRLAAARCERHTGYDLFSTPWS